MDNDATRLTIIGGGFSAVLTAIFSAIGAVFWRRRNALEKAKGELAEVARAQDKRIQELEKNLAVLTETVRPFWSAAVANLVAELKHPHTPELDDLLARVGPPSDLSDKEMKRAERLLLEVAQDTTLPASERGAAFILPTVIARATAEYENPVEKGPVQLVTVPPIPPERG